MRTRVAIISSGIAFLAVAFGLYYFFPTLSNGSTLNSALVLSKVMIIGLALVVALMGGLGVVYWALGIQNGSQALGLPEGSVRALIAFSLVLAFVCMAAFLYSGTESSSEETNGRQLTLINQSQLSDLKLQFSVAYQTARNDRQEPILDEDKSPLYNATYFSKHNQSADDLAKQIFTTLATVFVSVVSFYFGSATTSSGVAAGLKASSTDGGAAAQPPAGGGDGSGGGGVTTADAEAASQGRYPGVAGGASNLAGDLGVSPLARPVPQQG